MLDSRYDSFDEQARFVDTLSGLMSWLDRIAMLSRVGTDHPSPCNDSELVDALLGVLSVRRTLRLALLPTAEPATTTTEPALPEHGEAASWLR